MPQLNFLNIKNFSRKMLRLHFLTPTFSLQMQNWEIWKCIISPDQGLRDMTDILYERLIKSYPILIKNVSIFFLTYGTIFCKNSLMIFFCNVLVLAIIWHLKMGSGTLNFSKNLDNPWPKKLDQNTSIQ